MAKTGGHGEAEETLRIAAADWRARMTGPDAALSRLEFERWRARDPRHREAYARIERADTLASAMRHSDTARHRSLSRARSFASRPRPVFYGIAAAALVVLSVTSAIIVSSRPFSDPGAMAAKNGNYSTRIGQIRQQRLTDGSTMILDTNSRVDVALSDTARAVRLLSGRARFDVAHDAARPFIVEAAGHAVTAKGTVFDVFIDRGSLRVDLLRGKVDVTQAAAGAAHMIAGQTLRTTTPRTPATIAPLRKGEDQWTSGMLGFDKTPLADLLEQTNRYSKTKIRLAEPNLGSLLVTGAFRPLPINQLAAGIAAAFSLRADHTPNGDIVLRRG
ncbi:FecR family protein [Sphingomonas glacialis]|uniref:DUF4880 domain-containing protein n=1 Tax=Sphingomonas glacialis TaxID=658225 RepID=A0A502FSZ0_9SPHN|nr:FecR domain-containing protein [Sphingomonas glacialis]TPG52236.1 DUF4880 domain-containing protein [Sphingomonas glacialis]